MAVNCLVSGIYWVVHPYFAQYVHPLLDLRFPSALLTTKQLAKISGGKPAMVTHMGVSEVILHICHNHHNRWLCKNVQSSVKFSNGYVNENVQFYKKCVILHKFLSV